MNQNDLIKLQQVILKIAKDFDLFCNTNGIEYFLMGGTALGAKRHKGFIPWDDDFDVFMTTENYLKFLKAEQALDTKSYYLQRENTKEWPLFFSKVRLNNTKYIEKEDLGRKMHNGVYIDVMCLSNLYNNPVLRWLQYVFAKCLSASVLRSRGYKPNSMKKKLFMYIMELLFFLPIKQKILNFVRNKNSSNDKFKGHFFGRARYQNSVYVSSWFDQKRYIHFEDTKFPVVDALEKYLEVRFGSKYLEPPSQKIKDQYPSHLYKLDLSDL